MMLRLLHGLDDPLLSHKQITVYHSLPLPFFAITMSSKVLSTDGPPTQLPRSTSFPPCPPSTVLMKWSGYSQEVHLIIPRAAANGTKFSPFQLAVQAEHALHRGGFQLTTIRHQNQLDAIRGMHDDLAPVDIRGNFSTTTRIHFILLVAPFKVSVHGHLPDTTRMFHWIELKVLDASLISDDGAFTKRQMSSAASPSTPAGHAPSRKTPTKKIKKKSELSPAMEALRLSLQADRAPDSAGPSILMQPGGVVAISDANTLTTLSGPLTPFGIIVGFQPDLIRPAPSALCGLARLCLVQHIKLLYSDRENKAAAIIPRLVFTYIDISVRGDRGDALYVSYRRHQPPTIDDTDTIRALTRLGKDRTTLVLAGLAATLIEYTGYNNLTEDNATQRKFIKTRIPATFHIKVRPLRIRFPITMPLLWMAFGTTGYSEQLKYIGLLEDQRGIFIVLATKQATAEIYQLLNGPDGLFLDLFGAFVEPTSSIAPASSIQYTSLKYQALYTRYKFPQSAFPTTPRVVSSATSYVDALSSSTPLEKIVNLDAAFDAEVAAGSTPFADGSTPTGSPLTLGQGAAKASPTSSPTRRSAGGSPSRDAGSPSSHTHSSTTSMRNSNTPPGTSKRSGSESPGTTKRLKDSAGASRSVDSPEPTTDMIVYENIDSEANPLEGHMNVLIAHDSWRCSPPGISITQQKYLHRFLLVALN